MVGLPDYLSVRWTMEIVRGGADVCLAGAVLGCAYSLLAAALVVRSPARGRIRRAVPVTILKPLHGAEPRLFAQLLHHFAAGLEKSRHRPAHRHFRAGACTAWSALRSVNEAFAKSFRFRRDSRGTACAAAG